MRGSRDTRRAARLAERQHGNITYAQLRTAGLSARQVNDRIEMGWLVRRHRLVYAVGHLPRTRESRWKAAELALGDEAALSHRAGGALWEVVRGAVPTEVIVPTYAGLASRDGIIVHRAMLPAAHVEKRSGIRVTTLLRTVLDLAAVLEIRPLGWALDEAQVSHHLKPDRLAAEVLARRGYRGNARLGLLLKDAVDPAKVRSILELRFLKLCASHDIPRPLVNEEIDGWTPDFLWPEQRVIVETDGYAFHRTAAARRRDALKDEYLRGLGFTVIRLTWADVTERPAESARVVFEALAGAVTVASTP